MKTHMLALACLSAGSLAAATFSVNSVATLRAALATAQTNGAHDTINVAAGAYAVSNPLTYSTAEPYSLSIVGTGAATTILDGGSSVQVMNLANTGDGGINVAGLTFRNGRNMAGQGIGGGLAVVCDGAGVPLVASCAFISNTANRTAGGVYVAAGTSGAIVSNCTAAYNTTVIDDAGGIYLYKEAGDGTMLVVDNYMVGNHLHSHAGAVGGVEGSGLFMYYLGDYCTIIVSNNVLRANTQESGGGAFYLRATSGAAIDVSRNTFVANVSSDDSEIRGGAVNIELETGVMRLLGNTILSNRVTGTPDQGDGGGLAATFNTSGSFEMRDNIIACNQANRHGGGANINLGSGISAALIVQNLFFGNRAGSEGVGGGLQVNAECDVTLVNNTFAGNRAGDAGGFGFYAEAAGDAAAIYNDVYWSNAPNALAVVGTGPIAAEYSDIENGTGESWFGTGCIAQYPLFVDDAAGDCHLQSGSPCIDAGTNMPWMVSARDLGGETRIYDGRVDMGCYEWVPEPGGIAAVFALFRTARRSDQ
jgi:hypothetical protein